MPENNIHARGPKGEAIVIFRTPNPGGAPMFRLASGERLVPGAEPGTFKTVDGSKTYRVA